MVAPNSTTCMDLGSRQEHNLATEDDLKGQCAAHQGQRVVVGVVVGHHQDHRCPGGELGSSARVIVTGPPLDELLNVTVP